MNRTEKIEYISKAVERIKKYDEQRKIACSCFGYDSESSFGESVAYCIEMMIDSVSIVIGDTEGIFDWYVWENDFGEKKLSSFVGDIEFVVDSVSVLVDVIEEIGKNCGNCVEE